MDTTFTPWASLAGGGLIGLSAVLLMLTLGRIMGATGILAGVFAPASRGDWTWRAVLVLGMMLGPWVVWAASGSLPVVQVAMSPLTLIIGGLIVGVGVTLGGGCTSGHGVCGLARLSPRSAVAVVVFMASAVVTVFVIRHMIGG
ncbi:MAG: YeeE/YedE family protein [Cypionkella sp.]